MPGTLLLAALLGLACTTSTVTSTPTCEVTVTLVEPTSAAPGDTVRLVGEPMTTDFDTAVFVGGEPASVGTVDRDSCNECDSCRSTYDCSACSDCSACDLTCEQTCEEAVTFVVPELPAGRTSLQLSNSHGFTEVLDFEVLEAVDTGADDTGSSGSDTGGSGSDTGSTGSDTGSTGSDTGSAGSDTGAEAASAASSVPPPGRPGTPGPWREGLVVHDAPCEQPTASAMSPR